MKKLNTLFAFLAILCLTSCNTKDDNTPSPTDSIYNPPQPTVIDNTSSTWNISKLDVARSVDYFTTEEKDMILELNKVRTNPKQYAEEYIKPLIKYFSGAMFQRPGEIPIVSYEGVKAVEECYAELLKTAPMGILMPEKGLSLAAKDHVRDQGEKGFTGHGGSDGSTPKTRMQRYGTMMGYGENIAYSPTTPSGRNFVVDLLVDDGVKNRSHRTVMLKSSYTQVGVSIGKHNSNYKHMCVMDFAKDFKAN